MVYAGLFNSSYHPSPLEEFFISTPTNQLGPVETGQVIVSLLQGVMLVQYYDYLCNFWHEKRWTKWLVHLAFILCLAKFGYVWFFAWDRFVPHYGDWAYMAVFSKVAIPIGISTTVPGAVCQTFYIHRCWALSRNWLFMIPAVMALLLTVGSGVALTYGSALEAGGDVTVTKLILTSINISLGSALVCDVFITTFTCFYLIQERTGFKETDSLVMRLVKCSIESIAGPTICALVNLILSNKATDNQWFLFPNLVLSHIYGCSLLYSVNARRIVGARSPVTTSNVPKSQGHLGSHLPMSGSRTKPSRHSEYALQDRSRGVPKSGVFVEVQTVLRQDGNIDEERAMTESDGKAPQDDDSYVLSSHGKQEYFRA